MAFGRYGQVCRFRNGLTFQLAYGAEGMVYANDESNIAAGYNPYRKLFIGVDFDLTAFKSRSKALNTLIFVVNMVRIPAPALEFSKGKTKAHLFYF
jgi:hypothetical protein